MSLFCLDNNPCSEKSLMRFCKLIATKICHREKHFWGFVYNTQYIVFTIKLSFVFCNTSSIFATMQIHDALTLTLLAANVKLVSVLEDEVYHLDTSRVEQFHSG